MFTPNEVGDCGNMTDKRKRYTLREYTFLASSIANRKKLRGGVL